MKRKRRNTYLVSALTLALVFAVVILIFRDALPGMALVLHGVHGLPPQQLQAACAQGVSRVSFSKDIQAAELAALQGGGEGTVWERAEAGVRGALLRLLPLCGCQNRA